jgi:hypothetical protein
MRSSSTAFVEEPLHSTSLEMPNLTADSILQMGCELIDGAYFSESALVRMFGRITD